jgi:drug/metabolite transporter (DMT)-like permease
LGGRSRRFESGRPDLVVLLAASAAVLFGALAVTIRTSLAPGIDPEAASLITAVVACLVCVAIAAALGEFSPLAWRDTWPFFVAGIWVPGISQMLFTRAVGVIGPSRTAILVGISPVLSAIFAIALLDEPFRVVLALGTILVVAGGMLLAWEREGALVVLPVGAALAVAAGVLFAVRDNFVRWAATGNDVPGVVAAAASLATASFVILVVVAMRGSSPLARVRKAARPFLLSGLVYGLSYACLFAAFDRGRVTVVAPLYATESLWAVVISFLVLRRAERIGWRLLVAAMLVVGGGALISSFR